LDVYKREEGDSNWTKVLAIRPKVIERGGMTFDRGIGFYRPNNSEETRGFGIKVGLYMDKRQVWPLSANRVIYNDNVKIGDQSSSLAEMSPDGTTASTAAAPSPPTNLQVQ
jgi:hypothetical protein